MIVIFLNAIWMSIDIEHNPADIISEAPWGFVVMENLFCTYFTLELLIRFAAYKRTCSAFKDAWPFGWHLEAISIRNYGNLVVLFCGNCQNFGGT